MVINLIFKTSKICRIKLSFLEQDDLLLVDNIIDIIGVI